MTVRSRAQEQRINFLPRQS